MEEYKNFNSGKISWLHCGGNIDIFCIVNNIIELKECLNKYKEYTNNVVVIGAGSNLLIRDCGFKGLAIKLSGEFQEIKLLEDNKIFAGSAVLLKKISNFAINNCLIGCEFLDSIPGTTGGGIAMNAGCFGSEIKDILMECNCLYNNEIISFKNKDLNLNYRHSEIPKNAIILDAVFQLQKGEKEDIANSIKKIKEMQQYRKENQIMGYTCGSTFSNPISKDGEKLSAWKLIEEVGLRGVVMDGVKFSEKHCNFLVNTGTATATSVENLINLAKTKIKTKFNIDIKTEIKII